MGWSTREIAVHLAIKYENNPDSYYWYREYCYRKLHYKYGLKVNKYKRKCIVCNKIIESRSSVKKYCSYSCYKIRAKQKANERNYYRKWNKIGDSKEIYHYCKNCGIEFKTNKKRKIFCNKKCRQQFYNKQNGITKEEIISNMRFHFKRLKEINPIKAQKIADEMEILEGFEFKELAINGLAPFNNKKKVE